MDVSGKTEFQVKVAGIDSFIAKSPWAPGISQEKKLLETDHLIKGRTTLSLAK